jgi:hypothetical protein
MISSTYGISLRGIIKGIDPYDRAASGIEAKGHMRMRPANGFLSLCSCFAKDVATALPSD